MRRADVVAKIIDGDGADKEPPLPRKYPKTKSDTTESTYIDTGESIADALERRMKKYQEEGSSEVDNNDVATQPLWQTRRQRNLGLQSERPSAGTSEKGGESTYRDTGESLQASIERRAAKYAEEDRLKEEQNPTSPRPRNMVRNEELRKIQKAARDG
jgi:hypothetical protein